uniref:Uncharacterized protein n=1 Tax=Vespula pensylvanica TaxID=30213 RepID=A0A834NSC8_VESPE|nr:hypothetical protein H0235_011632 [Vespula pensylvanica]
MMPLLEGSSRSFGSSDFQELPAFTFPRVYLFAHTHVQHSKIERNIERKRTTGGMDSSGTSSSINGDADSSSGDDGDSDVMVMVIVIVVSPV